MKGRLTANDPTLVASHGRCAGYLDAVAPTCRSAVRIARCSSMQTPNADSSAEWLEAPELPLSKTELAVLRCLVMHEPRWLTSGAIIAATLGTAHTTDTSLIRVHVHAIRKKLGPLGKHVQSRRGRGYRFISTLQRSIV